MTIPNREVPGTRTSQWVLQDPPPHFRCLGTALETSDVAVRRNVARCFTGICDPAVAAQQPYVTRKLSQRDRGHWVQSAPFGLPLTSPENNC